jgi:hypothetical protein
LFMVFGFVTALSKRWIGPHSRRNGRRDSVGSANAVNPQF